MTVRARYIRVMFFIVSALFFCTLSMAQARNEREESNKQLSARSPGESMTGEDRLALMLREAEQQRDTNRNLLEQQTAYRHQAEAELLSRKATLHDVIEALLSAFPLIISTTLLPLFIRLTKVGALSLDNFPDLEKLSTLSADVLLKKAYFEILEDRRRLNARSMWLSTLGVIIILVGAGFVMFQPIASGVTAASGLITTVTGQLFGRRIKQLDQNALEVLRLIQTPAPPTLSQGSSANKALPLPATIEANAPITA